MSYPIESRVRIVSDDEYNGKEGTVWSPPDDAGLICIEIDGIPGLAEFKADELQPK